MLEILTQALKDSLLYGCYTKTEIQKNLLTIQVNSDVFNFDFRNGKVENVWYNGIKIPLPVSEKFKITLLLYES